MGKSKTNPRKITNEDQALYQEKLVEIGGEKDDETFVERLKAFIHVRGDDL
ncbi:hypothetical protein MKX03_035782, partial [Papaver bracteatum]